MIKALSTAPVLAATALALSLLPGSGLAMTAGAGRADIVLPSDLLPFQNFSTQADPLKVRALILGQGDQKAAIVVLDMTSLFTDEINEVRAIAGELAGIAPDHTLVIASHTFSAPHLFPPRPANATAMPGGPPPEDPAKATALHDAVNAAVRKALSQAIGSIRPASLAFGTGVSNVNVNRNVKTAQGWWLGANEAGPSDKVLQVLKLDDETHRTIAVLTNYAVQSSIMDQTGGQDGKKVITADLGGGAMNFAESRLGDSAVAMFLTGAAGDQVPAYTAHQHGLDAAGLDQIDDIGPAGLVLVKLQGNRLGQAVVTATATASPASADRLVIANAAVRLATQDRPKQLSQLHPSTTYQSGQVADAPYTVLVVGDLAIVGVQVELSASTGAWIRSHSPFAHTMVVTMVNGAAKYLPDAGGYSDITYEAMNSSYAPGGAEKLAGAVLETLKALKPGHP